MNEKEEIIKLNERLARMGEALKWCEENRQDLLNFATKYKGCFWPEICNDENHNKCGYCKLFEVEGEPEWETISSHDPDWLTGRLRKAKDEGAMGILNRLRSESKEIKEDAPGYNYVQRMLSCAKDEMYRQPKEAREKPKERKP